MRKILVLFFLLPSCNSKEVVIKPKADYINAAYIINGGDNSITKVSLETLELKNTLWLENTYGFFAHHINSTNSNPIVSIALPSYDFSNGHAGLHSATNSSGKVLIYNLETQSSTLLIDNKANNHNAMIHLANNEVWTTDVSHSGKVKVYNGSTGNLVTEIAVGADPSELVFAKSQEYALVAAGEGSFLTIIDTKTKNIVKEIKVDKAPSNVWPGFDDNTVFVENNISNSLNIVNLTSLNVEDFIDFSFRCGFMIFNELRKEIWVCSKDDNTIKVFSKNSGSWSQKVEIKTDDDPHQIKFNKKFDKAFLVNQKSNTLQVFNTEDYKLIKKINTGLKPNGLILIE